jgi:hypothetical protein
MKMRCCRAEDFWPVREGSEEVVDVALSRRNLS